MTEENKWKEVSKDLSDIKIKLICRDIFGEN